MLNNINFNKLKNKLKLYNARKNVLTIGLSLIISSTLTSCSNNTGYIKIESMPTSVIRVDDTNDKNLSEYLTYFSTYKVHYNFEKQLLKENEVNDILSSYDDSECKYNYEIDIDKLIKKINSNSTAYLKQNKQYESAFMNDMSLKETDEELFFDQFNFEMYLEFTLMQLFKKATNDINEDIHKMQELKIVFGNTHEIYEFEPEDYYVLGYYDNERNIIVLSREYIKKAAEIKDTTFEYVLYDTLIHEINHMRQYKCDCRKGDKTISYDKNYITTLIESSAESEIYNLGKNFSFIKKDSNEYSYYNERTYENLLFLLSIYNENVTIEDYYNAIFDSDMNALLDFYNLNTYLDKQNFFNILYTIDGINCRNDLIYDCYSNRQIQNLQLDELKEDVGYGYKIEIFKKCLKDAVIYTMSNPDFELEDNLLIFNIIKNKILHNSYGIKEEKGNLGISEYERIYDENFVNQMLELENKYIEFLESYYCINKIDILEKEIEIEPYIKNVVNSVNKRYDGDLTYYDKTVDILNRFPILKTIIYSEYYDFDEYSDFKEEVKTKSLKLD
ncbi:MAG: hypothetical protein E7170_00960 [Firmicutes bacterium]|nr:hypothetical protein [Bacillota bacterium]